MIAVVIGSAWAQQPAEGPPAGDPSGSTVARGWYAWRTGQDTTAADIAAQAVAASPNDLGALQLNVAMQVSAGNGFSVESSLREWWGEATADPVRRVALATAITFRHAGAGPWCDEVARLIAPVLEGDPHYWATLTDQQRELRCTGQSGHADAELRRLSKQVDGRGWAEGVLAKLETGYIKDDLPDELEKLWAAQPHRLDAAAVLWRDGVSGPGKPAAKKVANKALVAAVASAEPVSIHAALVAYTVSGQEKQAAQAAARLRAIDPAADPTLVRTVNDIHDPEVYAAIDGCAAAMDVAAGRTCLDGLTVPATGSVAAYAHHVRRQLFEAQHLDAEAYAEAKAGYEADRTLRFGARTFSKAALARGADLELAAEALEVVLAGRVPTGPIDAVPQDLRAPLARDLELKVEVLRKLGRPADALPAVTLAQALQPTPARQLLVGLVQAEAGQGDTAALALSYALVAVIDDTARVTAGRDALARLAWLGSAQRMIDAAARTPEDPAAHPLVGKKLADPGLLPTPRPAEPGKKAPPPGIRVVATWATWRPESTAALQRLSTLAQRYADRSVTVVALGVDPEPATLPAAPVGVEVRHAGPSAMRALSSVALPTVLVIDAKGTVVAALSPYDPGSLSLENAIDPLLPSP